MTKLRLSYPEREMAPGDVAQLVNALLHEIRRGELEASAKEIDFLESVARILSSQPATASPR